ncbi:glycosyltransferase family 4 protein [Sphingobium aromaticiconvertens]|uniref:glycosyltransferase family 4 protein n=1 Tax=Sphingobium aromaticiconvertens TaxID=365341 RepID=UPI003018A1A0
MKDASGNKVLVGAAAPLRLCLFTRAWRASGAGLYASELARGMAQAGVDVTFLAPRSSDPRLEQPMAQLTRLRQPHERPGAGRLRNLGLSLARMAGGFLLLARARIGGNRLFVMTIMDPLPVALLMLLFLRISGGRIIYVVHDPIPHAWHLPSFLRRLEQAVWRLPYRLVHALVVLAEPTRLALREDVPNLSIPVAVIDLGIFATDAPAPLPGTGTLLLFGTLRSNKGVLEAIAGLRLATARTNAPLRLLVRGGGHRDEAAYLAEIRKAASDAGAVVDLEVGYVDEARLADLIARCDALLMPYKDFHSQSGVALLAAGHARPVIASAAGGIATLMGEGMPCSPIARPVAAATVSDAVIAFLDTPFARWEADAFAYREAMLDRYSWGRIGRRFADLARSLA